MVKSECFGTDKVLGDPMAELPTPYAECVGCPSNEGCYYEYGQLSKKHEIARQIRESGTWRGPT